MSSTNCEDEAVDDMDDPGYEEYQTWYGDKVHIEDASTLQDFVDIGYDSVLQTHLKLFDVDSVIDEETMSAWSGSGDEDAAKKMVETFDAHYGLKGLHL